MAITLALDVYGKQATSPVIGCLGYLQGEAWGVLNVNQPDLTREEGGELM